MSGVGVIRHLIVRNPSYRPGMDLTPQLDLLVIDCPDALALSRFCCEHHCRWHLLLRRL